MLKYDCAHSGIHKDGRCFSTLGQYWLYFDYQKANTKLGYTELCQIRFLSGVIKDTDVLKLFLRNIFEIHTFIKNEDTIHKVTKKCLETWKNSSLFWFLVTFDSEWIWIGQKSGFEIGLAPYNCRNFKLSFGNAIVEHSVLSCFTKNKF